ncbi:lysin [Rhodococcus phage REQ1]|uniref:transglycosylase n=1 Tax=Rhodococcus phage REQ1 TaxID=1109712 RepID=UPI00023EEC61|nr:transglycosylase [Rhodococcus phage REQ1]AEV52059.1 lysin [Rhodococcus phage REQ1]
MGHKGKHRKQTNSNAKRFVATATGVGALGLVSAVAGTPAASAHDWSGVAHCESSGNWSINTGNGFYGGLQFTQSTWDAFKPEGAAWRADLATMADQIAAAEATLKVQGIGAWPVCGAYLGWGGVTPGVGTAPSAPSYVEPAPAPAPAASWVQPVTGTKSQGFHGGHNGVDIAAPIGTPIYAAASGSIDLAGFNNDPGGYGNYIQQTADNGAKIQYGHISEIYVSAGDYVTAGTLIAAVGNAGSSTGAHLHLRINAEDPEAYLINQGVALDWSGPSGLPVTPAPAPVSAPGEEVAVEDVPVYLAPAPEGVETVTVVPGDTLSHIAEVFGIDSWETLWDLNKDVVENPHLIYPGQVLRLA